MHTKILSIEPSTSYLVTEVSAGQVMVREIVPSPRSFSVITASSTESFRLKSLIITEISHPVDVEIQFNLPKNGENLLLKFIEV